MPSSALQQARKLEQAVGVNVCRAGIHGLLILFTLLHYGGRLLQEGLCVQDHQMSLWRSVLHYKFISAHF